MIDPSAKDEANRFLIFFQVILHLSLRNDLDEAFLTIRCVKLDISSHRLQNFIPLFAHHYIHIQLLRHMFHNFLLSISIQSDVDPSMLVQIDQSLDKLQSILQHFLPLGKLKLFLEEGVIDIEQIYGFGAGNKCRIPELWWIEEIIILKYLSIEANISRVEDSADVALKQDHRCTEAVVRIEEGSR